MLNQQVQVREGSSKDSIYRLDVNQVRFRFTKYVSVFDVGRIPVEFSDLDYYRCAISSHVFRFLNKMQSQTHYSGRFGTEQMDVMALDIPEKGLEFKSSYGRLLPLEILFRRVITKKFFDRIERGEVNRGEVEKLLVGSSEIRVGARLHPAYVECSTKHQAADSYIDDAAAAKLADIPLKQLHEIYEIVRATSDALANMFRSAGFSLATGKIEGGILNDGSFIIADSISPDELELIGEDGRSYDKNPVRQWYEANQPEWVARLLKAKAEYRNDKSKWPTYEAVPPAEVIDDVVERYRMVKEALDAR